ncbi:hypothetical protein CDAR_377761, partial [Caerostris darwini]
MGTAWRQLVFEATRCLMRVYNVPKLAKVVSGLKGGNGSAFIVLCNDFTAGIALRRTWCSFAKLKSQPAVGGGAQAWLCRLSF